VTERAEGHYSLAVGSFAFWQAVNQQTSSGAEPPYIFRKTDGIRV
jgi:hypothetical protein